MKLKYKLLNIVFILIFFSNSVFAYSELNDIKKN